MEDFASYEKCLVRELSCRLCLCTDVAKLKPLTAELKRKLKKMFKIDVRNDDNLPRAICHECLQQVGTFHRYSVRVDKAQNFLQFYHCKMEISKTGSPTSVRAELPSSALPVRAQAIPAAKDITTMSEGEIKKQHIVTKISYRPKPKQKRKSPGRHREALSLEEFIVNENVDQNIFTEQKSCNPQYWKSGYEEPKSSQIQQKNDLSKVALDPLVLVNGKPAKTGQALDNQISLFYRMECMVCHETGFQFKSLMRHYRDKHGVPGYVTCCDMKFHYFYPKKIIEHMAYHLQPAIFMCTSCHESFQSSQELAEHRAAGGRSQARLTCQRCHERYPTWRELGRHLARHRDTEVARDELGGEAPGKQQCDYCGKWMKHHHRKKRINGMEDLILCSPCTRVLRSLDRKLKTEDAGKFETKQNTLHHTNKKTKRSKDNEDGDGMLED